MCVREREREVRAMTTRRIPPRLNVQPQEPSMTRFLYAFICTHTDENSFIHERDGVCV